MRRARIFIVSVGLILCVYLRPGFAQTPQDVEALKKQIEMLVIGLYSSSEGTALGYRSA
jgi:hypothetical protein